MNREDEMDKYYVLGRATIWDRKAKVFRASAAKLKRVPLVNKKDLAFIDQGPNSHLGNCSFIDCQRGVERYSDDYYALDAHDHIYWERKRKKVPTFEFMRNIVRDHGYELERGE